MKPYSRLLRFWYGIDWDWWLLLAVTVAGIWAIAYIVWNDGYRV